MKKSDRGGATACDTLIPLGRLVNVHATHGELRLLPFNPDSATLKPGVTVILRRAIAQQQRQICAVRPHKRFLLVTFDGCDSMNAAEELVGYEVCVREAELPPAGPHEVYHYQLIGMTVLTTAGVEIGVIAEVLPLPQHDVCVVRTDAGEHLIPMIAEVVKKIDHDGHRLVIEPLPGLLGP